MNENEKRGWGFSVNNEGKTDPRTTIPQKELHGHPRSSSVRVKFYGQERERETRLGTRQFQLIQRVLLAVILCPRFCFKASEIIRSQSSVQEIPACLPERWPVYGKREREVRNEGTRISDRGQRSVKFQTSLQEGLIAFLIYDIFSIYLFRRQQQLSLIFYLNILQHVDYVFC
jgi:hypothetical protein